MGLFLKIAIDATIEEKPAETGMFQELNELYRDQGLQFDEYGNPVILPEKQYQDTSINKST